jgi:carboxypeptidase C (cathepsin A)
LSDSTFYSSAPGASLADAIELSAVTHHQIVIGAAPLAYTATAGHLTAHGMTTGTPQASFFYVAYTVDNQDPGTRPVTFFYNGGPGSATVWLHLGSFGPKRLVTGDPSTSAPAPFPLVDNAESLLDLSDLVFVDAVGSGYSEAIAPNTNHSFWSVDKDAAVFRDFVMRYLTLNNRSDSPIFLFGESYGTTRSAVLAYLLESAGVQLNGIVLQSSILDYNSNCGVIGDATVSCAGYLPTYGAAGAWYSLANPNPTDLTAYTMQLRTLTTDQFDPAVHAYLSMGTAPDDGLLTRLASTTGLSSTAWQTHFNMNPGYFQSNLISGTLIGRYDARVSAPAGSFLASQGDPSYTFISSSFAAGITGYLSSELKYTNPSSYVTLSEAIQTWDYTHDSRPLPDTIPDLAAALAYNPKLRVLSVNGYHDLATPFFQTELDLGRLGPNPNVQIRFYSGGHMTYLDDVARPMQKADLVQFYRGAQIAP